MYFFGLSKEEVLSEKHVVSYKETSQQNQITLFGRQVYQMKSEISMSEKTELEASVTVRNLETKPSFLSDRISSNILKAGDQSSDNKEPPSLLDLNSTPVDDSVSEPRYCFLQDLNCPYMEETEISCDKSGIGSGPSSPQCQNVNEKDSTASPSSYTSCCTTENNSRTEPSCRTRLEFPEEEDLSELIQMAAESLVHISETSYQNQSKPASRTNRSDVPDKPEMGKAEPECSCDSYELHTLGITETNTGEEDLCVSSIAIDELNNMTRNNNKEIGVKLRRGRRMKNFQKEVLPSLPSLSRHEIREDINILEAVLRSKEYKKMQGKTKYAKFGANSRNKCSGSQRCLGKRRQKA